MWRRSNFPQNEDSDQSISEDELNDDCISLGAPATNKGEVQVLSQLDILRGADKLTQEAEHSNLFQKRQADLWLEDDVDFPGFGSEFYLPGRASICNLDDEVISDNEEMAKNTCTTKCIIPKPDYFQKSGPSSSGYMQKDRADIWPENVDLCNENDVEFPPLANEHGLIRLPRKTSPCNSDDEIVSDDENVGPCSSGFTTKDGMSTWPANMDAETLVFQNNNAGSPSHHYIFSNMKRSCKVGRGKGQHKFPIHNVLGTEDRRNDFNVVNESHGVLQEGSKRKELKIHAIPTEMTVGHNYNSMAERLACFQERNEVQLGSSEKCYKTKRSVQLAVKRRASSLGHRNMDDYPEGLESDSSNADELSPKDNHQNLGLIIPEHKQKTMADQFQEAFGAASVNNEGLIYAVPRDSRVGLHGMLQRVMQSEKEVDFDFLDKLQVKDEGSHIDVKILSTCLEAKLTVCSCSLVRDDEGKLWAHDPLMINRVDRTMTIIFSSRVCSDVELEVGNLIRIHHPWREIHVLDKEETTILSTYFSHF